MEGDLLVQRLNLPTTPLSQLTIVNHFKQIGDSQAQIIPLDTAAVHRLSLVHAYTISSHWLLGVYSTLTQKVACNKYL